METKQLFLIFHDIDKDDIPVIPEECEQLGIVEDKEVEIGIENDDEATRDVDDVPGEPEHMEAEGIPEDTDYNDGKHEPPHETPQDTDTDEAQERSTEIEGINNTLETEDNVPKNEEQYNLRGNRERSYGHRLEHQMDRAPNTTSSYHDEDHFQMLQHAVNMVDASKNDACKHIVGTA